MKKINLEIKHLISLGDYKKAIDYLRKHGLGAIHNWMVTNRHLN